MSNAPSFDDDPVMEFFTTSTKNLIAAARGAGVGHYVAVSIVGCDQLPESGYMRAKVAQEELVEQAEIPYTIVRATQFAGASRQYDVDSTAVDVDSAQLRR